MATRRIRGKRGPEATKKPYSGEALRIGQQIRRSRGSRSVTEVALSIGISQVALSNIENGLPNPNDPRTRRTLSLLARKLKTTFGVPGLEFNGHDAEQVLPEGESPVFFGEKERELVQQLADGEGMAFADMARELIVEALMQRKLITSSVEQSDVVYIADYLPKPVKLKLLGEIAAGEPIHVFEGSESIDVPGYKLKTGKQYFVLRVRGNSMTDEGIFDGSFIICEATETAKKGDRVVALIDGEKATVKKYYPERKQGRIRLQPANALHKPIYVAPERLKIQGVVIGTWRP